MPSIFTQIIKGSIPSYKIFEDEKTFAFLDIHPVAPGHVLVVPKIEVEFVWDLPDEYYAALMSSAKKVALRLRSVLDTPYIAEMIVGVDVPHAHVQLIPFSDANVLGRVFKPEDRSTDDDVLAVLAEKLSF